MGLELLRRPRSYTLERVVSYVVGPWPRLACGLVVRPSAPIRIEQPPSEALPRAMADTGFQIRSSAYERPKRITPTNRVSSPTMSPFLAQ